MKWENKRKTEHGCCYPESKSELIGFTKAIDMISQDSSTSGRPHSPTFILSNEERRAVEAYKLQVEMRRSMAIEYARRNSIR